MTFLDLSHEREVLDLVRERERTREITSVRVRDDPNQAARHAERIVVVQGGRIVAVGTPAATLTSALRAEVFRVPAGDHPASRGWLSSLPALLNNS